ncbi:hypothetical protein B0H19DRAFT_1073044 [Mycena capillaripes]|nr:hypothetical protein B0H19DRAFT_1073044 [Mycena capillaripes]
MASLPLELLQGITTEVEHGPSIYNLRLVSKIFNFVASPLAFRMLVVDDNLKSAEAISSLQGCDESLTSLVRELVFRGDREGETGWRDETSGESERNALKSAFSGLSNFPNLQSLRFDFHNCYQEDYFDDIPEDPTHFALLQTDLFAALTSNPPHPLVSLTLNNMIAMPDDIYAEEDFLRIFTPLQQLNISVLSTPKDETAYFRESIMHFWHPNISYIIRRATALTTLTICSDQPIGAFNDATLPHLTSLVLHQFVLHPSDPDADVVTFILRHRATLTRLELRRCSIHGGSDEAFPRPWYAVLNLFETELRGLREFVFERDENDRVEYALQDNQAARFLYTRLDPKWGFVWTKETSGQDRDLAALESLMAVVESRRWNKGGSTEKE